MPQNAAGGGSVAPQLGQLRGGVVVMYLVPWNALLFLSSGVGSWHTDSVLHTIIHNDSRTTVGMLCRGSQCVRRVLASKLPLSIHVHQLYTITVKSARR